MKNLITLSFSIILISCGGEEQTKEPWEFEVDFCEAQDGYAETDYDYQSNEIIVSCKNRVCYALCKPNAEYCPEIPCEDK